MNLLNKLNAPFPEEEDFGANVKHIFGVSVFIFFVLFVLRPFGIHNSGGELLWICVGFGVVTFVISFLYFWLFGEILKIKKNVPAWTLGKWILYMLGLLLCISLANLLFIKLVISPELGINFSNFLEMAYSTLAVGSIPVLFSGYFIQQKSDRKNQSAANDIQSHLKIAAPEKTIIRLSSSNDKQQLELAESELLYAESQQNYVAFFYLKDGQIKEINLRNTLKNIQSQLPEKPFFRCHQSYLVNTNLIENVSGNAQGLRLQLQGLPSVEIPVSRKYISDLKAILA
ncbi:MAG: hypothetical protein ACI85O_000535 [Saprospiraceae bacterium]|jgi:hypothetical protein